ncbi:MAG: hypothetical protein L3K15_01430 [Thermoplasmata archaeon]|nr:hypothetical protein [Thermoplasmata archaeon]
MPGVRFTDEARRQLRDMPRPILVEFAEIFRWLQRNPTRLPPWVNQKLLGEERGHRVYRIRVSDWRGVDVFDGDAVRFTRFRPRKDIGYGALPKS